MEIRRAAFWRDIHQLFNEKSPIDFYAGDMDTNDRLCSYGQFVDRLGTSVRRARRNDEYVLLVLIQFAPREEWLGESGGGSPAALLGCRVSSCIRSSDSFCNLGGARFAVLLEELRDPSAVPMVIEKLNATLKGACRGGRRAPWGQLNTGASLLPIGDMPVSEIWQHTEAALEDAMVTGPGAYSISPMATGPAPMERFELSRDLHKAFRHDEFEIVYQPILDVTDKRVHAFESLMRWRHPKRGCLCPATFLPLLEESGLIVPVGEKLLAMVCKTGRELMTASDGRKPRICVNVSFRQLADRGFLLAALDALYDGGLPPEMLQLEFSESALTTDAELVRRVLSELKNTGVNLAIDQFGAGQVPLAELVRLPVDLIKLDRNLVNRLGNDSVSQAIVAGTLALAGAASMSVAGVGVEEEAQTRILEKLGCCELQGSYYSYPVTGTEARALVRGASRPVDPGHP
jgi:EAL domain-containing protein (putative c-di-GMP-specific phosphodiesterase class I)